MVDAQEDFGSETVGDRLRRTREAEGLTLDDIASRTRIPIRHLRAIEDSNWPELPAVTYTVGFARSYANAIGIDGAAIGRELREQLGGGQRPPQVSPEFYAPPDPSRVPSRSLAWVAGLLLVALVAVYLIWRSQLDGDEAAPQAQAQSELPTQPQSAAPQQQAPQDLSGQQVTLVATGEVWFRVSDRVENRRIEDRTLAAQGQYQVPLNARQPVIATGRPQLLRVTIGGRDYGPLAPEERRIANVSLLASDLAGAMQGQAGAPPAR